LAHTRLVQQHAAAAFRYYDNALRGFDGGCDAVIFSTDAAVQGLDNLAVGIEPSQQPV
jgi:hypothetical protein